MGQSTGRHRLLEVDVARALTAIAVVAIHALGFSLAQDPSGSTWQQIDQALILSLRYSRSVFMFISGFALAYAYGRRELRYTDFLSRRAWRVALPYVVWSAVYLRLTAPQGEPLGTYLGALALGTAFYHLYYVVVSLQWYAVFPPLLAVAKRLGKRGALMTAGAVTVLYLAFAYWLTAGAHMPAWVQGLSALLPYRNQLLVSYLAYYLLGTLAGVRAESLLSWLRRHELALSGAMAAFVLLLVGNLVRGVTPYTEAIDVFRPIMVLYGLTASAFLLAISGRIADAAGHVRSFLLGVSRNSYVVYLTHPLVLYLFESHVVLPQGWRGPLVSVLLVAVGVLVPDIAGWVLAPTSLAPLLLGQGSWAPQQHQPAPGPAWVPTPTAAAAPNFNS